MRLSAASLVLRTGVLGVLCVLTACGSPSDASNGPLQRKIGHINPPTITTVDPAQIRTVVPEESAVSPEQQALRNDVRLLTEALDGHASLVSVVPDTTRGMVIVHWYGPDTAAVDQRVGDVNSPVEVSAALYSPANLQTAVNHLMTQDVGLSVGAAGVKLDGSGVQASVHEPPNSTPAGEIARHLSKLVGLPVEVDFDTPVAIPG